MAEIHKAAPELKVGFVLMHKFTLNAFAGFIDALRLAADVGGRSRQIHCRWTVMGFRSATSSCGVEVMPNEGFRDPTDFDYVAVCGGNDYMNDVVDPVVAAYLGRAASAGVRMIGICTGSFTLARLGLLGGRRACIHWNHYDTFREQFPEIPAISSDIFLDDGDRITCAGSSGSIDLALYLIARHCGASRALQSVRHMMLPGIRPPSYPQACFVADLSGVGDVRVRKATAFVEQRLDSPPPIEAVARHVGLSGRQLERAFRKAMGVTPAAFFRRMRLDYGRWLLENTDRSVTAIAQDCGFADNAHFSREFRAVFGTPPSQLRRAIPQGRHPPAMVSSYAALIP